MRYEGTTVRLIVMEPNTSGVFPGKSPSLYWHSGNKDNTSAVMYTGVTTKQPIPNFLQSCLFHVWWKTCFHENDDLSVACDAWCRKHEWIVKGGEEVRIDQRIEQLFDVMNGLMHRQPGAAVHSLQVTAHLPFNSPVTNLTPSQPFALYFVTLQCLDTTLLVQSMQATCKDVGHC